MKLWTLAGLLTGLVALSIVIGKRKPTTAQPPQPSRTQNDPDSRYTIDDFLTDQEL